ncbi:FtsX-like permease family protein [Lentzea tibetensis]
MVSDSTPPRTVTAAAVAMPQRPKAPIALMTEETAKSLGFGATTFTVYATTTREPTVDEQDRLQAALGGEYEVRVDRAVQSDIQRSLTVLAIAAAVITLGAAALATGLAAADGRADLTTLAAVGASPTLRRLLSLSQSGVIAGLGSLLGTAAGLATSVAVLTALNQRFADQWPPPTPYPITVPWVNVAVALVLVPVVAMLGSALLTRSRLPIERRG